MKQTNPSMDVRYRFYTGHIGNLEGKMLTLIEASIQDLEQRKALKDIVRQTIWSWAIENNMDRDHEENSVSGSAFGSVI